MCDKIYTMRYMGSKIKLLDFVIPIIESLCNDGDTIIDLMAGTHSVGYALKPNHRIICNDIQEYSRNIGVALIENNGVSLTKDEALQVYNSVEKDSKYNLFEKFYSDTYFSKEQCVDIDKIRHAADLQENEIRKALILTGLMYAMGYCQSSAGHFAQYMPKDNPRIQNLRKLSIKDSFVSWFSNAKVSNTPYENVVLAEDYSDLLSEDVAKEAKVVYLDPPYSEAQYSRFYHLLETMVKYDFPALKYKGLYREDRFQSNFCYKNRVGDEFEKVARLCKENGSSLVISYSDKGLIGIDELTKILKCHYDSVDIHSKAYKHSMQGRGMTDSLHEIVISCH